MQEIKSSILTSVDDFSIHEVSLERNSAIENQCSCKKIFIYVLSGSCTIDTVYNSTKNSVVKNQSETYKIENTVWYKIKNESSSDCKFLIVTSR
jgi:hypothetical protein